MTAEQMGKVTKIIQSAIFTFPQEGLHKHPLPE
jgi:hypothetical protein